MKDMQIAILRRHSGMNPRQFQGDALMEAANEADIARGYELAWELYQHGGLTPVVIGENDDFDLGFWAGIGDVQAWNEGWDAAKAGVTACPYLVGTDDECFRDPWLEGFADAMLGDNFVVGGQA